MHKGSKIKKPPYRSSILKTAKERVVEQKHEFGGIGHFRKREYFVRSKLVGIRWLGLDGTLQIERPMRDGLTHGIHYEWHEGGELSCSEPYRNGFEWWLNPDGKSVSEEAHWWEDKQHGIHRVWKSPRRLERGYP